MEKNLFRQRLKKNLQDKQDRLSDPAYPVNFIDYLGKTTLYFCEGALGFIAENSVLENISLGILYFRIKNL